MNWNPFNIFRRGNSFASPRKHRPRRQRVLLEVTPLEDRTVPSNVNVLSWLGGQDYNETVLTPANVNTATFGNAFTTTLDGTVVDAAPLYDSGVNINNQGTLFNVVYVATTGGNLYAINANTGAIFWHDSFVNPSLGIIPINLADLASGGVYGIRETPVIDASTGTIFVLTNTRQTSGSNYDYVYQLWDINLATGATGPNSVGVPVESGGVAPVTIGAASEPMADIPAATEEEWCANWNIISGPIVQGNGAGSVNGVIQFNACAEYDTAALTLDSVNGSVYVSFSGMVEGFSATSDNTTDSPYHGWVLGYNAQTLAPTAVWNDTPNGAEGGIWLGGGGLAVDAQGDLYVTTGNGDFSSTAQNEGSGTGLNAAGFPADGNYGDSVVKLQLTPPPSGFATSGSSYENQNVNGWGLTAIDYFTPYDQIYLGNNDLDFGSSPVELVPNPDGTPADPDLLVLATKSPFIYVMDPNNLGKYNETYNACLQSIPINVAAGQYNQIAAVTYFNGTVYITGFDQVASAYSLEDDQLTLSSQSTNTFGYAGANPVVSADGTSDGIVWELDVSTNQLFAYNASNLADELWGSNEAPNYSQELTGQIHQFNVPIVTNGMVYVATGGYLNAYGLLYTPPSAPANLTATAAGTNQINLSWTNPTTTQNEFEVQRSLDGVNFTTIATVSTSATSYADLSVAPNTTYYYQVVATNQGVVSGPSNEISATTAASTTGTAPLAPSGLLAVAVAGAAGQLPQVNLAWSDNNPGNETAFLIEESLNGGAYALLEQVPASQTTYSDLNLAPGNYAYEVISTNAKGNSSPSAAASTSIPTVPATPSLAQVTALSTTQIDLSWQNNATNALGVQIFRRLGSVGDYTLIATLAPNTTAYQDMGLTPGTLYDYQIKAYNISGHFSFAGVSATTPALPEASLVGTDDATEGNWQGNYGADGYNVIGAGANYPTYAQVTPVGASTYVWTSSTSNASALQNPDGTGSIAAAWYGSTFTVDVNIDDGQMHTLSLYLLDWGNSGRSESIEVLNGSTGAELASTTVSNFSGGEYVTWLVQGNVQFVFTCLKGPNAVLSGLFFGGATPAAGFISTNNTTGGNWQGSYGSDGYNVIGTNASYPAYAQVATSNAGTYVWASSTTATNALENPSGTGRIAATLDGYPSFTVDVNILDGLVHTVSFYLLDWTNSGRSESIDVLNALNGDELAATTASNFSGGEYVTFTVQGDVQFVFTSLAGPNAVLSGMFFGGATPSASLVSTANTGGNWQGSYGADGYNVIGASASYPAYAQVTPIGASTYVWTSSTSNPSALQNPSGTGSIAAAWDGYPSFTVDVNLLDGQVHTLSLYLLDWTNSGRSESIDVLNASTGAVLAATTVSNFEGGEYVTFTVQGDVQLVFTSLAGPNAVLSGLFFGGAAPAASVVGTNTTAEGNWQGSYGTDGYNVIGASASYPAYAQVTPIGAGTYVWASSTTNTSALENPSGTGRVAATWYGNTFTIDVDLLDGQVHTLALYLLDWGNEGRSESIEVLNAITGTELAATTAANFSTGEYITFSVQGDVQLQFTSLAGPNAVLSGLFFGGATPAASLVSTDNTTGGKWQGTYGADGYNVIGASASYPAYAQVTPIGAGTYVWAASTTNTGALTNPSGTGSIAAAWYAWPSFTVDVNILDGQVHTLSLYLFDWGNAGRSESIEVLNASTGAELATTTASNFGAGEYVTFTVQGNVQFVITSLAGPNAVLSGLFFGGATPAASLVGTDTTTAGAWQGNYGADGYNVIGASASYPAYAQVTPIGASTYVWAASTTSKSALANPSGTGSIAAAWYAWPSFSVDVNILGGQVRTLSLYLLDWGNAGRSESIEVLNANTGAVLSTTTASNFSGGEYLTFSVQGSVKFVFTSLQGPNAVLSGLFFGGATPAATLVTTDTTTAGNWQGVYGTAGYNVIGAGASYPAYVQVSPVDTNTKIWAASTTSKSALANPNGTGGIAAAWYGSPTFSVDVDFLDDKVHKLTLYLLDWANQGLSERIDVLNSNGAVLATTTVSNFSGGEYVTFSVQGNVQLLFASLQGPMAVVSGVFFE